ncbi:MAG: substrate-binding domain-containing protein [Treponema sp.]|nr:substrate-binding domain-containing protein [Treponema sp.]
MKRFAFALVLLALTVSTAWAAPGRDTAAGEARIGVLMRNVTEAFLADYVAHVNRMAAERGVTVNVQNAMNAPDTQLTQLQTLINQGFRYFIIIPVVSELSDQMNQMIHAVGGAAAYSNIAPTTSSLLIGPNFFYASSPELVGGRYQGQLIADFFDANPGRAPGRNVNMLLILGELGHPAQVHRETGLMEGLRDRGYNVNIIARATANWSPDQANELMNAWIASFAGQFNVVAAQNDGMALGAVQSMIHNGMVTPTPVAGIRLTVPVFGIDATAAAIASMRANELYATVLQDSAGQSRVAFDLMYQIATGTFQLGNVAGGISPATTPITEAPVNDARIVRQSYLVPFVPVDRDSEFYRNHP